jgi:hypothetical protein
LVCGNRCSCPERIEHARAEAWNEGHTAYHYDGRRAVNPYRTTKAGPVCAEVGLNERLVTVLAEHAGYEWWPMTREFICTCETSIGTSYPDPAHRAHVAAALTQLVETMLAAEWDEMDKILTGSAP